jgi:hypothetical protein
MKGQAPDRVRRVSVTDPVAAARRYDYADAVELRLEGRRSSTGRCLRRPLEPLGKEACPVSVEGARVSGACRSSGPCLRRRRGR